MSSKHEVPMAPEGEALPREPSPKAAASPVAKISQLAKSTGNIDRFGKPSSLHHAAAGLHGWDVHRHHANGELELTEHHYREALKAAERPSSGSVYRPHKPAVSPYSPFQDTTP